MRQGAASRIGVDIDAAVVRLLQLAPADSGGWRIDAALEEPLAPAAVVAGSVCDAAAVGVSIERLVQRAGCRRGQPVMVAASTLETLFGCCKAPFGLAGNALENWLQDEAERCFTYPRGELGLDFAPLDKPGLADGQQAWLLVAVQRAHLALRMAALALGGLTVTAMDAAALALARAVVCAARPSLFSGVMLEMGREALSLAWLRQGQLQHFEMCSLALSASLTQRVDTVHEWLSRPRSPPHRPRNEPLILLGDGAAQEGLEAALKSRLADYSVEAFRLDCPMSAAAAPAVMAQPAAWALAWGLACKEPMA